MLDLATMLRTRFGRRIGFPPRELPKFLVKLAAPAAGLTRRYVDRNVGWPLCLDSARARTELGVEFRAVQESVVEHFQQMIDRSEEHTSELQSRGQLVCRLLLEKNNNNERCHETHSQYAE